jgi:hypothetical protein
MGGYPFRFPRSSRWMPNCRACRVSKRNPVIPARALPVNPKVTRRIPHAGATAGGG